MGKDSKIKVIVEKFSKLATSQFMVGIILGALSSILVNFFTVQYEKYTSFSSYRNALVSEINSNLEIINKGDNEELTFRGNFLDDTWHAGLQTGQVYLLEDNTILALQDLYSEIGRENDFRQIQNENVWGMFFDGFKDAGHVTYYEEALDSKKLSPTEQEEYKEKLYLYDEESDITLRTIDEANNAFLGHYSSNNTLLEEKLKATKRIILDDRRTEISILKIIVLPILILILTAFTILIARASLTILRHKNANQVI
ncbi:hypothetical protein JW710_03780 [Candidatus Dojkabacteria bacterium]|nr:hypothetical protein [Candidatus Dojkabacteria bacterium]